MTAIKKIHAALEALSANGAEGNYVVGVALTDLLAADAFKIPNSASLGITVGWNYGDAIFAIALGLYQLFDADDYRQVQNKTKGLLNILSGVQLFALSYNPALTAVIGLSGGAALAGPSFALAMLCDLVTASIDYANAYKEVTFEGWLDERVKEINFVVKKLKKVEEQTKNENLSEHQLSKLQLKNEELKKKKDFLIEQVSSRSRVYCYENNALNQEKEKKVQVLLQNLDVSAKEILLKNIKEKPTQKDFSFDENKQAALTQHYKESRRNLCIKAFSFVGMTLLAVLPFVAAGACPPVLIPALAVISLVAAYYLVKHSEKIVDTVSEGIAYIRDHSFFKKPHVNNIVSQPDPSRSHYI